MCTYQPLAKRCWYTVRIIALSESYTGMSVCLPVYLSRLLSICSPSHFEDATLLFVCVFRPRALATNTHTHTTELLNIQYCTTLSIFHELRLRRACLVCRASAYCGAPTGLTRRDPSAARHSGIPGSICTQPKPLTLHPIQCA